MIFLCIFLIGFSVRAQNNLQIDQFINQNLNTWISTYQKIHASPELSGYEEHTSELIAGRLKGLGYDVTDHLGKYKNRPWKGYGVVGILKNGPGPVLLIRTEMDALPVLEKTGLPFASQIKVKGDSGQDISVMHACGHDIHMSVFLGVAETMTRLKKSWHGILMMVAQPSEEGGPGASGAEALLADGLYSRFYKPDFILGLHQTPAIVSGKVALLAGYTNATSRDGEIIVHGTGSHAAKPQDGKDPIVMAAQLIMALQTIISRENNPFHPAVLTIGSINGGSKSNIIPDEVTLKFTLRALDDGTCDKLASSLSRISRGIAFMAGMDENKYPFVHISKGYPSNYNDPGLTESMNIVFQKAVGKDNVQIAEPVLSGEDFSYYSLERTIPSLFFNIGGADPVSYAESVRTEIPLPANHSPYMKPLADLTIKTGVKTMTAAAITILGSSGTK